MTVVSESTEAGASRMLRVELSVVRSWKGAGRERFSLRTAADAADCGFAFASGESYLVYATERDGALWVDRCGRTRLFGEAATDLGAMGLGVTPVDVEPEKDEDEARAQPPARGGCAGCRIGTTRRRANAAALLSLAVVASFAFLRRRAHRRRAPRA